VGVIPEDWDYVSLKAISTQITDGDHLTPNRAHDGYYLLSARNVRDGFLDLSHVDFVGEPEFKRMSNRCSPQPGDLLISCSGHGLGRVAIIPKGLQCVLVRSAALVKIDRNKADSRFAQYCLQGENAQKQISDSLSRAAQPNLFLNSIEKLCIPFPPILPEQRAIATALSDVDALLEGLDRLITKKRDLKQAAMQQLLTGQTRLPGFRGTWEVKRLEEVGDIRSGGTPSTTQPHFWDGDVPWCTPTDITGLCGRKYLTDTTRMITGAGLQSSSAEIIPPHSLIMTSRATIGECAINLIPMTTNQGFKNIVPFVNHDVEYLYYLMTTQKNGLIALCGGSTFLEIGKKQLSAYEITLPIDRAEQTAIAAVLSDMDAELVALESRRDKTRALKQGMMQELLTGRIRLVESGTRASEQPVPQTDGQQANIHFKRSVLAAEIVDRMHEEPTFGHVKFEKMMFLVEHLCAVDTGSTYLRKAAGPYDNRALRSIDSQLRKQQWFDCHQEGGRYRYVPMEHRGGHKRYFERYFQGITESFENVLQTFKTLETERCEIVATLLAAWSDLLQTEGTVSDERIVHEVLNNWHESKRRIPEDRWLKALGWMRSRGFVPRGGA
jgi:type I restriction enzyme S subunit